MEKLSIRFQSMHICTAKDRQSVIYRNSVKLDTTIWDWVVSSLLLPSPATLVYWRPYFCLGYNTYKRSIRHSKLKFFTKLKYPTKNANNSTWDSKDSKIHLKNHTSFRNPKRHSTFLHEMQLPYTKFKNSSKSTKNLHEILRLYETLINLTKYSSIISGTKKVDAT